MVGNGYSVDSVERRSIESVSWEFRKMSTTYYSRVSPLYERLSMRIADDPELL